MEFLLTSLRRLAVDLSSLPGYDADPARNNSTQLTAGKAAVAVSIALGIFAAIAVLMITIGGLQYVISQGDPQKVSKAKDTIMYAVIGLLVSASAYGIVAFIVNRIST